MVHSQKLFVLVVYNQWYYLLTTGCWVVVKGTSEGTIGGMVPSFGVPISTAPAEPGIAPDGMPVADL